MKMDDHQLLAACLDRDAEAWEVLIRRFSNLIYRTIQGTARIKNVALSRQDLEDLLSTVFLELLDRQCHKLRKYRGNKGCTLASWIRMITQQTVLDHFRRTRDALACRDRLIQLDINLDLATPTPSPLSRLTAQEKYRLIDAALQVLSPRDQLIIRMHCMEGCSLKTMAKVLKVSQNNIHSVKHRAVHRLQKAVDTLMCSPLKNKD